MTLPSISANTWEAEFTLHEASSGWLLFNSWLPESFYAMPFFVDLTLGLSFVGPGGPEDKATAYNAGDLDSITESGRSPGEGNGNPLCTLAWKIPGTEEPGSLQPMGSQRVRHSWATALSFFFLLVRCIYLMVLFQGILFLLMFKPLCELMQTCGFTYSSGNHEIIYIHERTISPATYCHITQKIYFSGHGFLWVGYLFHVPKMSQVHIAFLFENTFKHGVLWCWKKMLYYFYFAGGRTKVLWDDIYTMSHGTLGSNTVFVLLHLI